MREWIVRTAAALKLTRKVASDPMSAALLLEGGLFSLADITRDPATWMEATASGWVDWARNITL